MYSAGTTYFPSRQQRTEISIERHEDQTIAVFAVSFLFRNKIPNCLKTMPDYNVMQMKSFISLEELRYITPLADLHYHLFIRRSIRSARISL